MSFVFALLTFAPNAHAVCMHWVSGINEAGYDVAICIEERQGTCARWTQQVLTYRDGRKVSRDRCLELSGSVRVVESVSPLHTRGPQTLAEVRAMRSRESQEAGATPPAPSVSRSVAIPASTATSATSQELASVRAELATARSERDAARAELASLKREGKDRDATVAQLQAELASVRAQLASAKTAYAEIQAQSVSILRDNDLYYKRAKLCEEGMAILRERLAQCQSE